MIRSFEYNLNSCSPGSAKFPILNWKTSKAPQDFSLLGANVLILRPQLSNWKYGFELPVEYAVTQTTKRCKVGYSLYVKIKIFFPVPHIFCKWSILGVQNISHDHSLVDSKIKRHRAQKIIPWMTYLQTHEYQKPDNNKETISPSSGAKKAQKG